MVFLGHLYRAHDGQGAELTMVFAFSGRPEETAKRTTLNEPNPRDVVATSLVIVTLQQDPRRSQPLELKICESTSYINFSIFVVSSGDHPGIVGNRRGVL